MWARRRWWKKENRRKLCTLLAYASYTLPNFFASWYPQTGVREPWECGHVPRSVIDMLFNGYVSRRRQRFISRRMVQSGELGADSSSKDSYQSSIYTTMKRRLL